MKAISINVKAMWDADAKVWFAKSDDLRGLATEAATLEDLHDKVLRMVSELLELNGHPDINSDLPEIPVHIMAEQYARVANPGFK